MTDLFGTSPPTLPVISLWQPWASLCFVSDPELRKVDETRHWQYPSRLAGERIAIHAARRSPNSLDEDLIEVCEAALGLDFWRTMPLGAIIGTVKLGDCRRASDVRDATTDANRIAGNFADFTLVKGVQRIRYAWALHDPVPLARPIPMNGKQGWSRIPRAMLEADA